MAANLLHGYWFLHFLSTSLNNLIHDKEQKNFTLSLSCNRKKIDIQRLLWKELWNFESGNRLWNSNFFTAFFSLPWNFLIIHNKMSNNKKLNQILTIKYRKFHCNKLILSWDISIFIMPTKNSLLPLILYKFTYYIYFDLIGIDLKIKFRKFICARFNH